MKARERGNYRLLKLSKEKEASGFSDSDSEVLSSAWFTTQTLRTLYTHTYIHTYTQMGNLKYKLLLGEHKQT